MIDLHIPENAPADLFITDALDSRPARKTDYVREGKLIQALAMRMIEGPDSVMPDFVDLALAITGAVSGGLSLWEPEPEPGVFRWRWLRGALAPFEGGTTPRNYSPCGITLDRNEPVLTLAPHRIYGWLVEAKVALPEVLLVPLYLGGDQPRGTLWVVAKEAGQFTRDDARLLSDIAACVGDGVARTTLAAAE